MPKDFRVLGYPSCAPDQCGDCHNMNCQVHLGYTEAVPIEAPADTLPLARKGHIKGHSNCTSGECDEGTCKNVACGIYQGYESPEFVYNDEEASTAN